ncbi:unnamed protein product [Ambrosiozyma monospora]|uniref:Unnamed protein product n=1 Tax=Ambrosiozyma monospora TaxID=43982 RepID=A0ACB5U1S4_AMBMO|nr:unnamed protein product [Ambrosiozyma monospora]
MHVPANLPKHLAPHLPVATIILLLEHISIAKSFGRVNDYKINPNQELIAIGVTNLISTFFHAYPATGSFSRTALKAKCGVRTPFAGVFTGCCVLLAIYCFTSAFYYIPKAALSAVIIHAVSDLLTSWRITYNLYKINPLDLLIFIVGVFICVFSTIENGIYFAIACSAAVLLWRLCIPNGAFLGRVKVVEVVNPQISSSSSDNVSTASSGSATNYNGKKDVSQVNTKDVSPNVNYHYSWVPLNTPTNPSNVHTDYVNSRVQIEPPPPGVFVFRPTESFVMELEWFQKSRQQEETCR